MIWGLFTSMIEISSYMMDNRLIGLEDVVLNIIHSNTTFDYDFLFGTD